MFSPLNSVSEFKIALHRALPSNEHVVMLGWDDYFAVCKTQPGRSLVMAPNYEYPGGGLLTAPLSFEGLRDLLSWVDRPTALSRFNRLVMDFGQPLLKLCAVQPSGT